MKVPRFVMDYCFPSQGKEQTLIVLVVKDMEAKAVTTLLAPNKGYDEWVVESVSKFMDGCGYGRSILKSDGEPAMLALKEAVKQSSEVEVVCE